MPFSLHLAESDEEKRAVYRFRYDVYVEEMGRYRGVADHDRRLFSEPEDAHGRIFYALERGEVVGTGRLSWGGDAPFSPRQRAQYGLAPFLAELPAEAIAVGERGMVARRHRGGDLFASLGRMLRSFVSERRIQLVFGACEPHLLSLYLDRGHRTYARQNINSPESGYLIPIVMVAEDVEYLRRIGAPEADEVPDFGEDGRIPDCVGRLVTTSAVRNRGLSALGAYWGEVDRALDEAEAGGRLSPFHGLSEEEAVRCLGRSNIIECRAGDRVLKKGGVARNLFVVLDGTLEVRDGDDVVNVLGPGEVFGEIAFLLGHPRSMDVVAATDDVRVLSLSETQIRRTIETAPEIAADLLLNLSKMLCLRLLRRG